MNQLFQTLNLSIWNPGGANDCLIISPSRSENENKNYENKTIFFGK